MQIKDSSSIDRLHLAGAIPYGRVGGLALAPGLLKTFPVYITKHVVVEKPVPVPEPVIIEKPYHVPVERVVPVPIEKIIHKPVPIPIPVPQVTFADFSERKSHYRNISAFITSLPASKRTDFEWICAKR